MPAETLMVAVRQASKLHAEASANYWDAVNSKASNSVRHAAERKVQAAKAARTKAMHALSDAMARG